MTSGSRVMIWLNYRQNANGQPTLSVPCPADKGTPDVPWWYNYIAQNASLWAGIGFTDVLFPNPIMGQGDGPGNDSYNPFDDYDVGSKGNPTRFGYAEYLRRAVAICRANGMNVWLDVVNHQRMGGNNGTYLYRSATGPKNGRFPKTPGCFSPSGPGDTIPPYVTVDPVPAPADNFPFGNPLAPVNSNPKRYVWDGLIDAGDWLFRTLGTQGARLDDTKGTNVGFVNGWMTSKAMASREFFGEYDDGNPDNEEWWISQTNRRASTLDFAFQENMAYPMCMQAGSGTWHMSWMGNNALSARDSMKAVTFVSSLDSETDGWATIVNNKTLGLALMLGWTGLPMVYIKDWLPKSMNGYGLQKQIDNLVWCSRNLCNGTVDILFSDAKSFVFQRTGTPGAIIALNNDIWSRNWTTITCRTDFAPGTVLHDYTGKNGTDCRVASDGTIRFGIPPAENGNGYGVWAPEGHGGTVLPPVYSCTQELFGAADLDVGPVVNGVTTIGRFWIVAGSPVVTQMPSMDTTGWTDTSRVQWEIIDPGGQITGGVAINFTATTIEAHTTAKVTGWHTIYLTGSSLPSAGSAFTFKINYTATQNLTTEQFP